MIFFFFGERHQFDWYLRSEAELWCLTVVTKFCNVHHFRGAGLYGEPAVICSIESAPRLYKVWELLPYSHALHFMESASDA